MNIVTDGRKARTQGQVYAADVRELVTVSSINPSFPISFFWELFPIYKLFVTFKSLVH